MELGAVVKFLDNCFGTGEGKVVELRFKTDVSDVPVAVVKIEIQGMRLAIFS